ncbi:MAG: Gfo/Idh/MocA family oxidoreductase [Oscillospiraceae bacterium]|nr:Gfo/Idh/MocA family oxidoreductase [Oscillospiraceae bacterium]
MVNVAMIGCGAISGIYLKNLTHTFREVRLFGVCDLVPERAEKALAYVKDAIAEGAAVEPPKVYAKMVDAFSDPDVQVILNLTRPYEHYAVTKAALNAGKHVYSEKPLAVDMDEADELVELALKNGLYLGGAPDTFMGAGIQTSRKLIDDGVIGDVIGANVSMICHGHETWHPDPEFYYKRGGGPMMDMGPYYVTALVNLLGEAKGLVGLTKKSFNQRIITSKPHYGEVIDVDIDTHLTGNILFSSGAIASIFTTFDVHYTNQARFEVYGTKGTLVVPDPNTFGGPILLYRPEDFVRGPAVDPALRKIDLNPYPHYKEIPLMFDYRENSRGLGLADMCKAIEDARPWRANYRQQHHVLEILTGFSKASREGKFLELKTKYTRPAPMENNPMHGILD